MIRRQLFDTQSSTYTYLLADASSRLALLIDPVHSNVNDYVEILDTLDLRLYACIDTTRMPITEPSARSGKSVPIIRASRSPARTSTSN